MCGRHLYPTTLSTQVKDERDLWSKEFVSIDSAAVEMLAKRVRDNSVREIVYYKKTLLLINSVGGEVCPQKGRDI